MLVPPSYLGQLPVKKDSVYAAKSWREGSRRVTPFAKMVRSVDPLGKVPSVSMDDNRGCRANASSF